MQQLMMPLRWRKHLSASRFCAQLLEMTSGLTNNVASRLAGPDWGDVRFAAGYGPKSNSMPRPGTAGINDGMAYHQTTDAIALFGSLSLKRLCLYRPYGSASLTKCAAGFRSQILRSQ